MLLIRIYPNMVTNFLILGSGIREQAWAHKLKQSPLVGALFSLPASEGMASLTQVCDISPADHAAVARFCKERNVQRVLAPNPAPVFHNLLQYLRKQEISVISADAGCSYVDAVDNDAAAARIYGLVNSRVAWRKLMRQHGIPIPASHFLDNLDGVILLAQQATMPLVIKTDTVDKSNMGVCNSLKDVEDYLSMNIKNAGENSDEKIVLENFIQAPVVCVPVLVTGKNIWTAPYCQLVCSNHHVVGGLLPANLEAKAERAVERLVVVPWLHAFKEYLTEYFGVKNYQGMFSLDVAVTHKGPYLVDVKSGWDGLVTTLVLNNLASDACSLLQAFVDGFACGDEQENSTRKKNSSKENAAKKSAGKEPSCVPTEPAAEWHAATAAFCVPTPTEFKIGPQDTTDRQAATAVRTFQEKHKDTSPERNSSLVCIVHNADNVPQAAGKIADYWREKRWLPSSALQEGLQQAIANRRS